MDELGLFSCKPTIFVSCPHLNLGGGGGGGLAP